MGCPLRIRSPEKFLLRRSYADVPGTDRVAMPASVYYLNSAMNADRAIEEELQDLKSAALYRTLKLVAGEQGPVLNVDGREVINFSSNNYLGLANHPKLGAAAKEAIERYGCGSGASRR